MIKILENIRDFVCDVYQDMGLNCNNIDLHKIGENIYKGFIDCDGNIFDILYINNKLIIFDNCEIFVNEEIY